MMTIIEDVAGKVTALLEKYEFDASTLARYLGLSLEQVNDIAHGDMECLLEQRKVLDKIIYDIPPGIPIHTIIVDKVTISKLEIVNVQAIYNKTIGNEI